MPKQTYYHYMFNYGIIALLMLLRKYEQSENYEECEKIVACINKANDNLGSDFETNPHIDLKEYTKTLYSHIGENTDDYYILGKLVDYDNAASLIFSGDI